MLDFKNIIFFSFLIGNTIFAIPSFATESVDFDLVGDGQLTTINVAFRYYERRSEDCLTFIDQGGYKVYDISVDTKDVAVIGPISPCIGIVVTNGDKLIAFHKHSTNSFQSMKDIIGKELDLSNKENLYARIYSAKDNEEWVKNGRQLMHNDKSHLQELEIIENFFHQEIGINQGQVLSDLWDLRDSEGKNRYLSWADGKYNEIETKYEHIYTYIAVQLNDIFKETKEGVKQIKFSSIDPYNEDIFDFKGKEFTYAEYLGTSLKKAQERDPDFDFTGMFISYEDIPLDWKMYYGQDYGYIMQRGVCARHRLRELENNYLNYFGKNWGGFSNEKEHYNTLDFYPI